MNTDTNELFGENIFTVAIWVAHSLGGVGPSQG